MDKKRLFCILSRADAATVAALSGLVQATQEVVVVKAPAKTLAMIKLRETVESSLFYLGEVIVCEAVVAIGAVRGMAVTMGEDPDKALDMAVVDAAINTGTFTDWQTLTKLEAEQEAQVMRENALHLQTMVQFSTMDAEVHP